MYPELLAKVLQRARRSSGLNALVGLALVPVTLAIYGTAYWAVAIATGLAGLSVVSVRQWLRLRPGAPIVRALEAPTTIDRVAAWPGGTGLPFALQIFAGAAECKLKVETATIRTFVRALHATAPALEISRELLDLER